MTRRKPVSRSSRTRARNRSAYSKAKLCASKPDLSSFEGQFVYRSGISRARLDAVKAENPKLIAFYNSLDERQKRIFDEIRAHSHRR